MNEKHVVTKNANNTEKDITPCVESLGLNPEVKSADAESGLVGLFWLKE